MTAAPHGPGADRREAMRQGIRALLGPDGAAAALFAGYEARAGQLAMAERIADAIDADERLLVEAGTGTGKTLAYLVPALLSGRKVVVSTGTKTLQDQIAGVDLPRLRAMFDRAGLLPVPLEWAVMKGLSNYVCRRRLGERDRQRSLVAEPELDRILAFAASSPTGDRADLPDLADDAPLWGDVSATPETRIGPRCAFFETCFVTAMRRRAAAAPLIVVNHHLFFADLALKSRWPEAQVLPPYEVVIFDEAHQIEDVATEFFGVHASTQRLFALARDLGRESGVDAQRAQAAAGRLTFATDALADALRAIVPAARPGVEETRMAFAGGLAPGPALDRYHELDACLEQIADWLNPEGDAVARSHRPAELAALARRAAALRTDLAVLVGGRGREHVRWLAASPRNVGLHASPVDVSPVLGRALDACPGPIVLTSATLTVAGSFDYLRARVGLGDTATDATFASPFRYDRQALLYLAPDLPDPKHDAFALRAAERMAELCTVTGGRALLLFTSFRNMRVAEAHLREVLPFPLLVQGERPRHLLLAAMRERVGSVLLATQSFWEGVDIPGEALSLVVMDKIPFAVPDDPLTQARIDRIRDDGGEPFTDYQLPRAALALKQGFGRLIRTRTDRGIVAVLDGRVARKHYGATLVASLPADCPRTESLEDVVAFWTRGQAALAGAAGPASPPPSP
ncbi:MAG TPA: ATP-dependent DNA helicase [Polyangia bacterium]|jgi:ATP-dependent DNA helicase DinG